ncbi:MAG: hypothetical protein MK226_17565 [Saprospiraceae bacterium]|nr:hypothetical protein [Saprospiraceae bacterium]
MKKILLLILILSSFNLISQIPVDTLVGKLSGLKTGVRVIYSENDTVPVVVNLKEGDEGTNVLFYLNEEIVDEQIINAINPNQIKEVKIEKESIQFNEVKYDGIVYIRIKENYTPKFISLNELKEKYLNLSDNASTLFMLNEEIIDMDYDSFIVDEKYILKIETQAIKNSKEQLDMNIIKVITRTKSNIEKANTIIIKGVAN